MRGLTRSVIALIVPPLPAPSRPSKRMHTFRPSCTTHCWSLTNSTCRRASSRSYSFRFSLPLAASSLFFSSDIGVTHRLCRGLYSLYDWMARDGGSPRLQQSKHDGDKGWPDEKTQETECDKTAEEPRMVSEIGISIPKPMSHGLMKLS